MVGDRISAAIGGLVDDLAAVVLDRFKNDVLEDGIGVGEGVLELDKLAGGGGFRSGVLTEGCGSAPVDAACCILLSVKPIIILL
jgi:hypothetical protein